ncbi:MAG: Rieske (2Fe-2S) protein [Ignavibacteriae bacterium]|nr:MAG: Rieske (2Fe-2S) protein [Ignavibacteriota bacterium]
MDRKEFLTTIGVGAVAAFCSSCLAACKPLDPMVNSPTNVDLTLNLSDPAYSALNSNGGSIYVDNIIVARISDGSYVALSSICTHQGSTVSYNEKTNRFVCPTHGSIFATNGAVINGPASNPLLSYKTTINATSLRVYS